MTHRKDVQKVKEQSLKTFIDRMVGWLEMLVIKNVCKNVSTIVLIHMNIARCHLRLSYPLRTLFLVIAIEKVLYRIQPFIAVSIK